MTTADEEQFRREAGERIVQAFALCSFASLLQGQAQT